MYVKEGHNNLTLGALETSSESPGPAAHTSWHSPFLSLGSCQDFIALQPIFQNGLLETPCATAGNAALRQSMEHRISFWSWNFYFTGCRSRIINLIFWTTWNLPLVSPVLIECVAFHTMFSTNAVMFLGGFEWQLHSAPAETPNLVEFLSDCRNQAAVPVQEISSLLHTSR